MNQPRRSTGDRILKAGAVVLLAHVMLKVISLVQFRLMGQFCDKVTLDLFIFAFDGILGSLFLIGEESLGPAFLPVFMGEKDKEGEPAAWRFANAILSTQFVIIFLVIALVALAPLTVVKALTAWEKTEANPEYMRIAPFYIRYMVLALLGLSLGSTTYMLLNGYKRFFLAAFGDAAVKLGVVTALATAWVLGLEMSGLLAAKVFICGAIAGSALKLLTHGLGLRDKIGKFRISFDWKSPALRKFALLVAPLLLGIFFGKFRDLFTQIYVLSNVEEGLLALNAFGRKIYQTLGYMIPYAVSIAMLPFFCEMVDRDQKEELGALVTRSGRLILLICAPIAAGAIALSLPLAQVLFLAGKFKYQDCQLVATSNACYSLVLPFYALEYVMMQAFFSNRKMASLTAIGIVFSSLNMAIAYVGVVHFKLEGAHALAAVALAFTVSRTLKVGALVIIARRFIPCFPLAATLQFLLRVFLVAAGTGLAAYAVRLGYESMVDVTLSQRAGHVLVRVGAGLALSVMAGTVVSLGLMRVLCRADMMETWKWVREKIRNRTSKGKTPVN